MKKKNRILSKNLIILIFAALALGVIFLYLVVNKNSISPSLSKFNIITRSGHEVKILKSNSLKMSVLVPSNYQTEEQITFVNLIAEKGKINISRIATNFNDITSYLKDFDSKRKITVASESYGSILDVNYVSRVEDFGDGPIEKQKVYFIYVDGWIYALSTSSESLFPALDQIAQSFRYNP